MTEIHSLHGMTVAEILSARPDNLEQIGALRRLSPVPSTGITGMLERAMVQCNNYILNNLRTRQISYCALQHIRRRD